MSRPRRTRARRTLALLSLPAGALALSATGAVRRLRGEDPERVRQDLRARNADRTRRVLGDLKGGALKAGQLLSTVEALFPTDPEDTWREALTTLQERNAALPFAEVESVLRAGLGPGWRGLFDAFEEQAVAAASLGQVHRATWQGQPVAVKVQYPGVREALTSDLATLSVVSRAAALVARGLAVPPLVAEMRVRLAEELDYEHEARAQTAFAEAYRDDPGVRVPAVLRATPRVLVMEWLEGVPLARVAVEADQAERDRVAGLYQRFLVSGPERAGLLHTDPHPGNFRVLPDGRLGVLDFGSTLPLPGMPEAFGRLIRALLAEDSDEVLARLREAGFLRPGVDVDVTKLVDYMAPFTVPARHETFRFSRAWLRGEFGRVNDPRDPDFGVALKLTLPAEHLFTHRVWLSMVGVLCQLEAEVPVREVLERWLPGFWADTLTDVDLRHLRRCVDLAREALDAGDEPFGSVLVDAAGTALAEGRNRVVETGDATQHPEIELARWAAARLSPEQRAGCTVYTSGEHCPMCAAAHGWVGLGRVVYVSAARQLASWLAEAGVAPAPVAPLPVQQVAPGVVVQGPVEELAGEVRELQLRFHRAR